MAEPGHRHQLLLYTQILTRWLPFVLGIGIVMLVLTLSLYYLPVLRLGKMTLNVPRDVLWWTGAGGVYALLLALLIVVIRKSAYVQPLENHLRLATPFLHLKISYRRIRQSSSAELGRLFPPTYLKKKLAIFRPFIKHTLIVLDLRGFPLPRSALQLFLSPLFFPDKTTRLALLVPDWIAFSNEFESIRDTWMESQRQPNKDPRMALFSDYPDKGS
jgi:hypothetical protein